MTYKSQKDGLGVKSTGYPCIGPGFDSQHSHGSSQSSVTPALAYPALPQVPGTYVIHRHMGRQNVNTQNFLKKNYLCLQLEQKYINAQNITEQLED